MLDVGVKIAGALQTAHDRGLLHRDIKPQNLFISEFGEPALGDFGISTLDDERSISGGGGLDRALRAARGPRGLAGDAVVGRLLVRRHAVHAARRHPAVRTAGGPAAVGRRARPADHARGAAAAATRRRPAIAVDVAGPGDGQAARGAAAVGGRARPGAAAGAGRARPGASRRCRWRRRRVRRRPPTRAAPRRRGAARPDRHGVAAGGGRARRAPGATAGVGLHPAASCSAPSPASCACSPSPCRCSCSAGRRRRRRARPDGARRAPTRRPAPTGAEGRHRRAGGSREPGPRRLDRRRRRLRGDALPGRAGVVADAAAAHVRAVDDVRRRARCRSLLHVVAITPGRSPTSALPASDLRAQSMPGPLPAPRGPTARRRQWPP